MCCSYAAGSCVSYGFDADGNRTSQQDATGTTSYGYDTMNRQTSKAPSTGGSEAFSYDPVGNELTYQDGVGTVTYAYNAANQLTSLAEPSGSCTTPVSLCTQFTANNNGKRTKTVYPGGTTMSVTLDKSSRPTEINSYHGSSTIADFTYDYTKSGSDTEVVQSRTDKKTSLTTTYSYDALNALTTAVEKNSGGTTTASWLYCYDLAGNRTGYSTTTGATCANAATSYSYNAANELTAVNGSSSGWNYDNVGNETGSNGATPRNGETYSPSNQLTSLIAGTPQNYTYNGTSNDQRVQANSNTTDQYAPQGITQETDTTHGMTNWTRDPSGTLISERTNGQSYYYIFDGLGSVVALADSTGTAVNTYSYDPYGEPAPAPAACTTPGNTPPDTTTAPASTTSTPATTTPPSAASPNPTQPAKKATSTPMPATTAPTKPTRLVATELEPDVLKERSAD